MAEKLLTEADCKAIVQQLFTKFTDTVLRAALTEVASCKVFIQAIERAFPNAPGGVFTVLLEQSRQSPDIAKYVEEQIGPMLKLCQSLDPKKNWDQTFDALAQLFGGSSHPN